MAWCRKNACLFYTMLTLALSVNFYYFICYVRGTFILYLFYNSLGFLK